MEKCGICNNEFNTEGIVQSEKLKYNFGIRGIFVCHNCFSDLMFCFIRRIYSEELNNTENINNIIENIETNIAWFFWTKKLEKGKDKT